MMSGPACRCHHPLCPDCRGRVLAREALVRDAVRRVLADGFPMTPIYRVNRVADAVLSVPVVRDALARDATHDAELLRLIDERDEAQEWADRLAAVAGGPDAIGEHSNANNPWANALELLQGERG